MTKAHEDEPGARSARCPLEGGTMATGPGPEPAGQNSPTQSSALSAVQLPALAWILLAGAVVRLALWAWFRDVPISIGDEKEYHALAANLATRGEFAFDPGMPTSIRPPLYPALVAVIYRAFGTGNIAAVRLVQCGLSLVTVVLAYRLGTETYGRRAGLWAAALVGFYPSLLGYNNLLLTEVLFTALLTAACLALARAVRIRSLAWLGLGGVLLGLGALTRSVLWPFPVALGALLMAAWGGGAGRRTLAVAVLLAAFIATIAPWSVRNTRLQESFQTIDVMGGRNFMMGNYEYTPLYRAWDAISIPGERSWIGVLLRKYPSPRPRTQGQIDKLALRAGIDYARRHPGLTLRRDVIKFFDFWGLERELIAGAARGVFGPIAAPAIVPLTLLVFGSYAASLWMGIFGMVLVPPAEVRVHALLLLVIGFVCAVHTATFGHSRYHLPVMPLVLTYSAAALVHAPAIRAQRGRPVFCLAVALCVVLLVAWAWGLAGPDLRRYLDLLRPA
jgi:4-amino-4-deoxy-L-arabinose transferase-like glycosyltransferase